MGTDAVEHVFNVTTAPPELISVSVGDGKDKDANFTGNLVIRCGVRIVYSAVRVVEFYISDTQTRPTVRVKFGNQVQNLTHLSQILAR